MDAQVPPARDSNLIGMGYSLDIFKSSPRGCNMQPGWKPMHLAAFKVFTRSKIQVFGQFYGSR